MFLLGRGLSRYISVLRAKMSWQRTESIGFQQSLLSLSKSSDYAIKPLAIPFLSPS
jgi:hypothetical protein